MAGKDIAVKKYVVRLGAEEREQLQALIGKGKSPAKRLLQARILLKADISAARQHIHFTNMKVKLGGGKSCCVAMSIILFLTRNITFLFMSEDSD
ncbi:MAG: hypothetical protein WAU53_02070 [Rhodoplanes sp.]